MLYQPSLLVGRQGGWTPIFSACGTRENEDDLEKIAYGQGWPLGQPLLGLVKGGDSGPAVFRSKFWLVLPSHCLPGGVLFVPLMHRQFFWLITGPIALPNAYIKKGGLLGLRKKMGCQLQLLSRGGRFVR